MRNYVFLSFVNSASIIKTRVKNGLMLSVTCGNTIANNLNNQRVLTNEIIERA